MSEIKPTQRPPHPFTKLCAVRLPVVVQQKGGNIVRGRAKWHRNGFLKLEPATIIGKNHEVNVPWVLIENQAIAHLHPDTPQAGAPQPDTADTQEFRLGGTD